MSCVLCLCLRTVFAGILAPSRPCTVLVLVVFPSCRRLRVWRLARPTWQPSCDKKRLHFASFRPPRNTNPPKPKVFGKKPRRPSVVCFMTIPLEDTFVVLTGQSCSRSYHDNVPPPQAITEQTQSSVAKKVRKNHTTDSFTLQVLPEALPALREQHASRLEEALRPLFGSLER